MAVAMFYVDQGEQGGAIHPTDTGFDWTLVGIFREPSNGKKAVISGIHAATLDNDTLVQIRDKLAAAIKQEGSERGFNVTTVVFYPLQTLAV